MGGPPLTSSAFFFYSSAGAPLLKRPGAAKVRHSGASPCRSRHLGSLRSSSQGPKTPCQSLSDRRQGLLFMLGVLQGLGRRSESLPRPSLDQDTSSSVYSARSSALSVQLHRLQVTPPTMSQIYCNNRRIQFWWRDAWLPR
ncbi:hypothetical protein NDU88_002407 [Pleurodeles waltl]|uniref:Uncharacterized protein n=1 Tax=Pleurodeles waltl TaxID=8319 RepID=A0AAV7TKF6_PLEWA|nr:hypothetical protein NDU88_002407 [Pleurodeles waltl]